MANKSSPLSIRLDERDLAKLGARATDLGVSPGVLLRSLVSDGLNVDAQLEGLRQELISQATTLALLRMDLDQLNANLRDTLKAILCGQTGDEDHASEMADEVVKALRGEE